MAPSPGGPSGLVVPLSDDSAALPLEDSRAETSSVWGTLHPAVARARLEALSRPPEPARHQAPPHETQCSSICFRIWPSGLPSRLSCWLKHQNRCFVAWRDVEGWSVSGAVGKCRPQQHPISVIANGVRDSRHVQANSLRLVDATLDHRLPRYVGVSARQHRIRSGKSAKTSREK